MVEEQTRHSWWVTIPGILTAVAGVIAAISGLILVLVQTGILDGKESLSDNQQSSSKVAQNKPISPSPTSLNDGLVAYYSFSGNLYDESDNKRKGKSYGATFTKDNQEKGNRAYSFNGKDSYVNLGHINWYHNDSWTWVAWIKKYNKGNQMIMAHGMGWNKTGAYFNVYDEKLYITLTTSQAFDYTGPFPLNSWQFVCAVYNGKKLELYRNGELVGINDNAQSAVIAPSREDAFELGRHQTEIQYWRGSIDEVRIYDRALSKREINELYDKSK